MMTQALEVAGSGGRPVRAVAHGPETAPAVLIAHGFKGFKDWGFFPWIADTIAQAGLRALRLDFSHNGVEARDFDRLDLFLLDTPRRHQEDLAALAARVSGPLALLGHSRGGADALCFAASESRVRCCATLASVAAWARLSAEDEAALRRDGFVGLPNARTKQLMPVGRTWFEHAAEVDVQAHARRVRCPVLLTHGTEDTSVPFASMRALSAACPHAQTLAVEGANHTFGARHPWQGPPAHLVTAMEAIVPFLVAHLLGEAVRDG